jgi:hypothetical protein
MEGGASSNSRERTYPLTLRQQGKPHSTVFPNGRFRYGGAIGARCMQAMENTGHFIRSLRIALSILLSLGCLAGSGGLIARPAWAEKRIALAIGNDLYPNLPADRQLKKAVNDARTIADALKSLGFEVIVGTNLGRQAMIDKLADFTALLGPGDTAALFFAGHGVAIGGVNYLIPSDVPAVTEGAEARVRGASIAEPDLIAELQAKSVRVW